MEFGLYPGRTDRAQLGASRALRLGDNLFASFMRLMKADFKKSHQRRIQRIDPEHGLHWNDSHAHARSSSDW